MKSRYQALFEQKQRAQEGLFIPFVTLGDPDEALSLRIIDTLIAAGADALELGIPFSDPLADGPVIQNATLRALQAGMTTARCFAMLQQIRQRHPAIPIGLLMYANLVVNRGVDEFYARCAEAGVDSVLIADVPLEESTPFRLAAQRHHIAPVFICPPDADDALIEALARHGGGYTYLLSRAGVTGTEQQARRPLTALIEKLRASNAPPPIQGFGISRPEQVRAALDAGAAGAIAGSAIVRLIEQHRANPPTLLAELTAFVQAMKAATRSPATA